MEWLFGGLIFGIIIIAILIDMGQTAAKKAYQDSLEKLKRDPTNPDLRAKTLELGREYSNTRRDNKGHPLFDEMALMNDINAACARAPVVAAVAAQPQATPADQIQALANLMHKGVLTQQEFCRAKANVIGKPPSQVEEATKLLRHLHALHNDGVLSESEYNIKKWDILSQRLIPREDMPPRPDWNDDEQALGVRLPRK